MAYPVAQAWVFTGGYEPYVDWLCVMEDHRRAGIGTALLDAIRARWPDVVFDAFTDSGEKFLDAYEEQPPNTGTRLCDD
jgi:GNAT superfamily N-acetyltransferase